MCNIFSCCWWITDSNIIVNNNNIIIIHCSRILARGEEIFGALPKRFQRWNDRRWQEGKAKENVKFQIQTPALFWWRGFMSSRCTSSAVISTTFKHWKPCSRQWGVSAARCSWRGINSRKPGECWAICRLQRWYVKCNAVMLNLLSWHWTIPFIRYKHFCFHFLTTRFLSSNPESTSQSQEFEYT